MNMEGDKGLTVDIIKCNLLDGDKGLRLMDDNLKRLLDIEDLCY